MIRIPVLPESLLSVEFSPNQGCNHTTFYGKGFLAAVAAANPDQLVTNGGSWL